MCFMGNEITLNNKLYDSYYVKLKKTHIWFIFLYKTEHASISDKNFVILWCNI